MYTLGPKVVVVEDDPPIRNMYIMKLRNAGLQVEGATDGRAGLRLVEEFRPELILLDLKMPIMSGEEMLHELRSHGWGKNILVIVLTNISKTEAPMSLRFLDVHKYLVKAHHTPQQILESVEDTLHHYKKI